MNPAETISTALPDAGGPEAVGWLVLTLAALALGIERVLALVRGFRRQPPIEATFIPRQECSLIHGQTEQRIGTLERRMDRVEAKMESDKQDILHRIDALETKTQEGLRSIERAIGRLEGGGKQ